KDRDGDRSESLIAAASVKRAPPFCGRLTSAIAIRGSLGRGEQGVNESREAHRMTDATTSNPRVGRARSSGRSAFDRGKLIVPLVFVSVPLVHLVGATGAEREPPDSLLRSASRQGPAREAAPPRPSFAVGVQMMRFVDNSRRITLKGGRSELRTLVTYVWYP